jgi:hypothetical protein
MLGLLPTATRGSPHADFENGRLRRSIRAETVFVRMARICCGCDGKESDTNQNARPNAAGHGIVPPGNADILGSKC